MPFFISKRSCFIHITIFLYMRCNKKVKVCLGQEDKDDNGGSRKKRSRSKGNGKGGEKTGKDNHKGNAKDKSKAGNAKKGGQGNANTRTLKENVAIVVSGDTQEQVAGKGRLTEAGWMGATNGE